MKGLYKALTVCVYGCSKFTATGSDIQKLVDISLCIFNKLLHNKSCFVLEGRDPFRDCRMKTAPKMRTNCQQLRRRSYWRKEKNLMYVRRIYYLSCFSCAT